MPGNFVNIVVQTMTAGKRVDKTRDKNTAGVGEVWGGTLLFTPILSARFCSLQDHKKIYILVFQTGT
jgi:hypothetical protein